MREHRFDLRARRSPIMVRDRRAESAGAKKGMRIDNVCVLGGAGFVGTHLAARLNNAGKNVRVVTRRRQRHRDLLVLPRVEVVQADTMDKFGPVIWCMILTWPDTILMMLPGMKNGETLRTPPASNLA